jgi:hypothetical protein
MTDTFTQGAQRERQWRILFIILSALILILLPALSPAYGQTGDEWLQMLYGRDIWDYFFNNDTQALGYDTLLPRYRGMERQFKGQELYGGLFDFGTEVLHRWLPSIPHLVIRHFCNALTNVLLMVSTGLIARRLSGRWSVGVLALVLMVFSPRIFGEGMNNPKDIPFAAGFALSVYAVLAFIQDGKKGIWRHAALLTLGFGLAFGVRAAGGLLFLAYLVVMIGLWLFLHKDARNGWWSEKKSRNRVLLIMAGSLVAGYIIGLLAWPWGLESPVSNPIASLSGMTNRETKIRTLFEGRYQWNYAMPWYYELKWIIISNPLSVIIGAVLFVVLGFLGRKRLGSFTLLLVLFAALFPLLYMIYKNSSVYDTWRHVFFVYPFWVIMAALGWAYLGDMIQARMAKDGEVRERYIGHGIALLVLIPAILWTIRSHPNQYVYFNELTGGIRGAEGQYELDYYYNSSQQHVTWLRAHVPRTPGKKTLVLANMGGFGPNCLHNDTAYIAPSYLSYHRRATQPWEYYMMFPRLIPEGLVKAKNWLPRNATYVVRVDGVPLSALIKRTDTNDIAAERALAVKDYAGAAAHYAQYLKSDADNPVALLSYANALAMSDRLPEAIEAAQRVTKIDPEDIQAWGFLAQLYNATGNAAAAQDANNRAQGLVAEMQEDAGEEE